MCPCLNKEGCSRKSVSNLGVKSKDVFDFCPVVAIEIFKMFVATKAYFVICSDLFQPHLSLC